MLSTISTILGIIGGVYALIRAPFELKKMRFEARELAEKRRVMQEDEAYQRWVTEVGDTLRKKARYAPEGMASYPVPLKEERLAERAVREGLFTWCAYSKWPAVELPPRR